jgi:hypothetical protein
MEKFFYRGGVFIDLNPLRHRNCALYAGDSATSRRLPLARSIINTGWDQYANAVHGGSRQSRCIVEAAAALPSVPQVIRTYSWRGTCRRQSRGFSTVSKSHLGRASNAAPSKAAQRSRRCMVEAAAYLCNPPDGTLEGVTSSRTALAWGASPYSS